MKRLSAAAGLALALGLASAAVAPAALAQAFEYPANGGVLRAEAKAKAASGACEGELKARRAAGPGCARYHQAVLEALAAEQRRLHWCSAQMSESSNFKMTASCLQGQGDMRLETVEALERRVSPKAWKAFDDKMGDFAG